MTDYSGFKEIGVSLDGMVATVEIRRPPHNFFDSDADRRDRRGLRAARCRPGLPRDRARRRGPLVLRRRRFLQAHGYRHGRGSGAAAAPASISTRRRSACSARKKPIIGAIHGAAVGGGLGLALVPDFRVTCQRGAVQRQFQPARLSPRLRPDRDPAAARRRAAGGAVVLYRPPHSRRRGGADRARRCAGAAGRGAQRRAGAGAGDRAIGAARRACRRARRCAAACRRDRGGDRARAGRAGLAAPHRGFPAKASRRWPTAACPTSRAADAGRPRRAIASCGFGTAKAGSISTNGAQSRATLRRSAAGDCAGNAMCATLWRSDRPSQRERRRAASSAAGRAPQGGRRTGCSPARCSRTRNRSRRPPATGRRRADRVRRRRRAARRWPAAASAISGRRAPRNAGGGAHARVVRADRARSRRRCRPGS